MAKNSGGENTVHSNKKIIKGQQLGLQILEYMPLLPDPLAKKVQFRIKADHKSEVIAA